MQKQSFLLVWERDRKTDRNLSHQRNTVKEAIVPTLLSSYFNVLHLTALKFKLKSTWKSLPKPAHFVKTQRD
jgi:hypothetical protein